MARLSCLLTCSLALVFVGATASEEEGDWGKSIDEILLEANQGLHGMSDDGDILTDGDMSLTPDQYLNIYQRNTATRKRALEKSVTFWQHGIMPYEIAPKQFSDKELKQLKESFRDIEKVSCVRIVPRTASHKNYVYYQGHFAGCYSMLGDINRGKQILNLSIKGCRFRGLYIHETFHSLGVVHEHQLWNRNQFVDVYNDNVLPSYNHAYEQYVKTINPRDNVEYSFQSIMHYGITAFSKDGTITVFPKNKDFEKARTIGRAFLKDMSYSDVYVLNTLYKCADRCSNKQQCGRDGHLDRHCKCVCKDGSQDCDRQNTRKSKCQNAYFMPWDCYRYALKGDCNDADTKDWMSKNCAQTCNTCSQGLRTKQSCINQNRNDVMCEQWAKNGDCDRSKRFMWKNCAKTCKVCDKWPLFKGGCHVNTYFGDPDQCDKWAAKKECLTNSKFMRAQCGKSCDACNTPEPPEDICVNRKDDATCATKKAEGKCESDGFKTKRECAKACDACKDKVLPEGVCGDRYRIPEACPYWKKKDQCERNPLYMNKFCAKTCGACTGGGSSVRPTKPTTGDCKNKSDDTQCDGWATGDGCERGKGFMHINCKKSCGLCRK